MACQIVYIGVCNPATSILIEVGNVAEYKIHFANLIDHKIIDQEVNYRKYYKQNEIYYHVASSNGILYCIIFIGGLTRTSENCLNHIMNYQSYLIQNIDEKTIFWLNNEFARILIHYNDPTNDPFYNVKEKTEEVKQIMQDTINTALNRGENLQWINDKANHLENHASIFNRVSEQVKKKMCVENVKIQIIIILIIIGALGLIALLIYGIYKIFAV